MRKGMMAMAVAATLAGCGDDEPAAQSFKFDLKYSPSVTEQAVLQAGLNAFMVSCEPLFRRYWGDVVEARAYMGDPKMNYTGETYGWTREIWIETRLAEKLKHVPASMRANGHTLIWVAGGGEKSGLIAKKDQAAEACGMAPSRNGSDVFKADDGFAVLGQ